MFLPAGSPIAEISAEAAAAFGLPSDVVIVTGTTDGCASFLATGADRPGDGVSALGTTLTVKMLSDKPLFAPEYGLYSHRIGDLWLAGGASTPAASCWRRFSRTPILPRFRRASIPKATAGSIIIRWSKPASASRSTTQPLLPGWSRAGG